MPQTLGGSRGKSRGSTLPSNGSSRGDGRSDRLRTAVSLIERGIWFPLCRKDQISCARRPTIGASAAIRECTCCEEALPSGDPPAQLGAESESLRSASYGSIAAHGECVSNVTGRRKLASPVACRWDARALILQRHYASPIIHDPAPQSCRWLSAEVLRCGRV